MTPLIVFTLRCIGYKLFCLQYIPCSLSMLSVLVSTIEVVAGSCGSFKTFVEDVFGFLALLLHSLFSF